MLVWSTFCLIDRYQMKEKLVLQKGMDIHSLSLSLSLSPHPLSLKNIVYVYSFFAGDPAAAPRPPSPQPAQHCARQPARQRPARADADPPRAQRPPQAQPGFLQLQGLPGPASAGPGAGRRLPEPAGLPADQGGRAGLAGGESRSLGLRG